METSHHREGAVHLFVEYGRLLSVVVSTFRFMIRVSRANSASPDGRLRNTGLNKVLVRTDRRN